jgi:hypothetical protein
MFLSAISFAQQLCSIPAAAGGVSWYAPGVRNQGFVWIKALCLYELGLQTREGDRLATNLNRLTSVEVVDLRNNDICAAGVRRLQEAMNTREMLNPVSCDLLLSGNPGYQSMVTEREHTYIFCYIFFCIFCFTYTYVYVIPLLDSSLTLLRASLPGVNQTGLVDPGQRSS